MLILHTYAEIKWKVSKYGVFSGLHFPVFGLNTEISVQIQENSVFMLHFAYVAEFPCCNISTFTFFALQFFHVALFSCCIFSSFTFFVLHFSPVALLSCCTFFLMNFVDVALFPCCTFLCCTFFYFFFFYFFSFCTLFMLHFSNIKKYWKCMK